MNQDVEQESMLKSNNKQIVTSGCWNKRYNINTVLLQEFMKVEKIPIERGYSICSPKNIKPRMKDTKT